MSFEGPNLPKTLLGHSSITQGTDLIIIGGEYAIDSIHSSYSSSLYKLKRKNGTFEWNEMKAQLKIPRNFFVAFLIPANLEFNFI